MRIWNVRLCHNACSENVRSDSLQLHIAIDFDTLFSPRSCALQQLGVICQPAGLEQAKGDAAKNSSEPELIREFANSAGGTGLEVHELDSISLQLRSY